MLQEAIKYLKILIILTLVSLAIAVIAPVKALKKKRNRWSAPLCFGGLNFDEVC